jgi:hypothetical protein
VGGAAVTGAFSGMSAAAAAPAPNITAATTEITKRMAPHPILFVGLYGLGRVGQSALPPQAKGSVPMPHVGNTTDRCPAVSARDTCSTIDTSPITGLLEDRQVDASFSAAQFFPDLRQGTPPPPARWFP